jgi:broad specificity phosphatase PhoE
MPPITATMVLCLLLAATACSALPEPRISPATFIVVRHAEKAQDDPRDPSLSDAGRQRAAALATALAPEPVVAVYATGFRRTRQTAEPIAATHGLSVRTYDATQAAGEFVAELLSLHEAGTVVVVGHSNTVPALASALCECTVSAIGESDYGDRYTIRIAGDGRPSLVHTID